MSFLTIDLETSGLIRKDLPLSDPVQPWAVSIAADLADNDGNSLGFFSLLIKPDGRKIQANAEKVHGISSRDAEIWGIKENAPLVVLQDLAGKAEFIVSFGDFDKLVITSLFARMEKALSKPEGTYGRKWARPGLQFVDVQKPAAQAVCKLPSEFEDGDYKWPSLDEACSIILGEAPRDGAHTAWDDLQRTKRLYLALRDQGHFEKGTA
jgi:DNA polymerase III epsilon subunit-like protein